jgi:hypothetical protein
VLELYSLCFVLLQNFGAWDNTMPLDHESIIAPPEPSYQLQNNTQSFELISLNSWYSWLYHQVSIMPPSSNTTPTNNSSLGYTTSTVHHSRSGGVNQCNMPIVGQAFTPSSYSSLQTIISTPHTPWRSAVLLGESKSLAKGHVPFLWRSSKQLSQL